MGVTMTIWCKRWPPIGHLIHLKTRAEGEVSASSQENCLEMVTAVKMCACFLIVVYSMGCNSWFSKIVFPS